MRMVWAALVLGTIAGAAEPAAAEVYYPWCAQYLGRSASTNCGFVSLEQCLADVRGVGGLCHENPFNRHWAADEAPRPRKHKHKRSDR
jgi:hypothetical protein